MSATPEVIELRFADIGEGLDEGEIVEWLVSEGDVVVRDQPLVAVETDKAVAELPSPSSGTVLHLHGQPGERVRVGAVLVTIRPAGAGAPARPGAPAPAAAPPGPAAAHLGPAAAHPDPAGPHPGPAAAAPVRAAPAVRRLAVEAGIDLAHVPGSGPDGRVTRADVEAARQAGPAPRSRPPAAGEGQSTARLPSRSPGRDTGRIGWVEPGRHAMRGVRRRTAEAMTHAWTTVPHLSVTTDVDATAVLAARDLLRADLARRRAGDPVARLSIVAFTVRAIAAAVEEFPVVNATMAADGLSFEAHEAVRVGVAVSTSDGLVVPVLADARGRSVAELGNEVEAAVGRARNRSLSPAKLAGGTITLTNYGAFGGTYAAPIVRSPEVAIVGMGQIATRPFVVDGDVRARPVLPLVLAADHRLVDGDVASGFLSRLAQLLAEPILLLGA